MKKTLFTALIFMGMLSHAQLPITLKASPYVNPGTDGQYPNATFEYVGEYVEQNSKKIRFIFKLKSETDKVITTATWEVLGSTPGGNTIKNEGNIKLSNDTEVDFITYLQGGGDLYDPTIEVLTYPQLSYDDVANYFVLGGKLDKIQLPVNANAQTLIKWLLEKTLFVNGEPLGVQFQFN